MLRLRSSLNLESTEEGQRLSPQGTQRITEETGAFDAIRKHESGSASVVPHPFGVGKDVAFHRGFEFGFAGGSLQVELQVEREQFEVVAVRSAGGRAGTVVSRLGEVVFTLGGAIGQRTFPRYGFGKAAQIGRDVPDRPVIPVADRGVGIVGQEREGLGAGGRIGPHKSRRDVGAIAGEFFRDVSAVGKAWTGEGERYGFASAELLEWLGEDGGVRRRQKQGERDSGCGGEKVGFLFHVRVVSGG